MDYRKYLGIILLLFLSILMFSGCTEKPENSKQNKIETPQTSNEPPEINQVISLPGTSNIDSISILINQLTRELPKYNSQQKDRLFENFRKYFYYQIDEQNRNFSSDTSFQNYLAYKNFPSPDSDSYLSKYKSVLNNYGMNVYRSNGIYYVDELPNFIYQNFKDYVSKPMLEFLNIRRNEISNGFAENDSLLIPFSHLGKRIVTWENFINLNPHFILDNEAKGFYDLYFTIYLTGMNNYPVFDKNGKLLNSVKESYEEFIKYYHSTKSAEILQKYLNLLAKDNYMYSKDIVKFLKENKIGTSFGDQPPMR